MDRFIAGAFVIFGLPTALHGLLNGDAIVFGVGFFFAVLGGADLAERLFGKQPEDVH